MRGPLELLQESWNLFKNNWKLLLGIFAVPGLVTATFDYLTATDAQAEMFMTTYTVWFVLLLVAMIVLLMLMSVGMYKAVSEPMTTTIEGAYRFAAKYFVQYLVLSIMIGVVVMLGFIALIIPGIIFAVWFAFAYLVLIFEGKKGVEAMKASKEYVKGNWWKVFGRFVVLGIAMILLSIVTGLLGYMLFSMFLGVNLATALSSLITSAIAMPIATAYSYLIYQDLKRLKGAAIVDAPMTAPDTNESNG